jgi:hypothetical protein
MKPFILMIVHSFLIGYGVQCFMQEGYQILFGSFLISLNIAFLVIATINFIDWVNRD